jgi:colanic acid biosynthesis glycosyl transferase WcaI
MVELLRAKGVAHERSVEFRNSADTSIVPPAELGNPMREFLNVSDDAKVALYSGALGSKQALEYLVEAAQKLADRRPDIVFVFCGAGSMKERLQENTKSLPNVRHLDLQPVERYGQLMAAADIHLLPQRPEVHDLMLPAKLPFMHATGRPVVAMAKPHTQLYAELDGAGVLIPPGDTAALIDAIVKLADDPELRASLGSKGRERGMERWDRNIIFRQVEARMYECCSWRNVASHVERPSETI